MTLTRPAAGLFLTLLLVSFTLAHYTTPAALACSCVQRTTEQVVADSEIVFEGSIQSFSGANPVFTVQQYYKGSAGSPLTVSDPTGDSASCSYFPNDATGRYLVFAEASGAEYVTSLCSGNASFADPGTAALVAEVEALTDPGSLPATGGEDEASEEGETEDLPWVPILILAFAIPVAVLLIPSFFGKGGSGGH